MLTNSSAMAAGTEFCDSVNDSSNEQITPMNVGNKNFAASQLLKL